MTTPVYRRLPLALLTTLTTSSIITATSATAAVVGSSYLPSEEVNWVRYINHSEHGLVSTADPRFKQDIEHCIDQVFLPENTSMPLSLYATHKVRTYSRIFAESSSTTSDKMMAIEHPDEESISDYIQDKNRLLWDSIYNEEGVKLCLRQKMNLSLTGISLAFSKKTGAQLEYNLDQKHYQPAAVHVDNIVQTDIYMGIKDVKIFPPSASYPVKAAQQCQAQALKSPIKGLPEYADIVYLRSLYQKIFISYASPRMITAGKYTFGIEDLKKHYEADFLSQSDKDHLYIQRLRLMNQTLTAYDRCMKEQYHLLPQPLTVLYDMSGKKPVLMEFKLMLHGFRKSQFTEEKTSDPQTTDSDDSAINTDAK
ncbi:MAG: hypothetical protein OIF57_16305 [Marinobacterium sp.]|nr:hypothetical protein [Marinobacterium sp.]